MKRRSFARSPRGFSSAMKWPQLSRPTPQGTAAYTYDDAGRLTGITQGGNSVQFAYDEANRRTTLTLANGISVTYGYDNANEPTAIAYRDSANNLLGDLSYTYDANNWLWNGTALSYGGSPCCVPQQGRPRPCRCIRLLRTPDAGSWRAIPRSGAGLGDPAVVVRRYLPPPRIPDEDAGLREEQAARDLK